MKSAIFTVLLFSIFLLSCEKTEDDSFDFQKTGKIEAVQATYWMYGTHIIEIDGRLYALSSKKIDLNKYNNQIVTILGKMMDGYPLEKGPPHVEVFEISKQ